MKRYTFKYYPNGINAHEITILATDEKQAKIIVKKIAKDLKNCDKIK